MANTKTKEISSTLTYRSWAGMRQRCLNPKGKPYNNYGGRGIKICDRWLESFQNFFDDMGEKPPGITLERIDNNGDYCPENCRWATRTEQNRNKRDTVWLTLNGETLTAVDWSRKMGLHKDTVARRLRDGWPAELLLSPQGTKRFQNSI